jgi:hypothetical protein
MKQNHAGKRAVSLLATFAGFLLARTVALHAATRAG